MKRACRILETLGIFLVCVILFASCATVEIPKQANTKESLRDTASLYWKLRMAGNYKDTFKFEDPKSLTEGNKYRGALSLEKYYETKAPITSTVMSITVNDVWFKDENQGRADMLFTISLPQISRPIKQTVTDEWIFRDGKWWHTFQW